MGLPDWFIYDIQKRWEKFYDKTQELREWFNFNPNVVIGFAVTSVIILVIMLILMVWPGEKPPVIDLKKEWYYDLNTGRLFTDKYGLKVPVETPSGPLADGKPAGVRAYVFSYAEEPNKSNWFIGFLEKPDPNVLNTENAESHAEKGGFMQWGHGRLIRRVEDKSWFAAQSKQGRSLVEEIYSPNAKNQRAAYFTPK